MQSHPASILATGMLNFFTGTKENFFLSEINNAVCRLDCGKNVSCWHLTL